MFLYQSFRPVKNYNNRNFQPFDSQYVKPDPYKDIPGQINILKKLKQNNSVDNTNISFLCKQQKLRDSMVDNLPSVSYLRDIIYKLNFNTDSIKMLYAVLCVENEMDRILYKPPKFLQKLEEFKNFILKEYSFIIVDADSRGM
ncbi:MAG: hypothetical protein GY730_07520 [bacterium]|nr:hypothetical protein [bacterium]